MPKTPGKSGKPAMLPGVHRVNAKGRWYYYFGRGKGAKALPDPEVDPKRHAEQYAKLAAGAAPSADTIATLIRDYKASPRWEALSLETQRVRSFRLAAIEEKFGLLPLSAITPETAPQVRGVIIGWQEKMRKTPRAADDHIEALNVLLNWGMDRGRLACNPAKGVQRLYHSDRSDVIFTETEIVRVLGAARPDLRRIIRAALLTGMRAGDLADLRWSDVDLDGGVIERATNKSRGRVTTFMVILPALRAVLAEAAQDRPDAHHDRVFLRGALPWSSKQISDAFDYVVRKLAIDKHFHDLRGNAATALMAAGVDPVDVDEWMGWRPGKGKGMKKRYVNRREVALALAERLAKSASGVLQ